MELEAIRVNPKNLVPNPLNMRKNFDLSDIQGSIKESGVQIPIMVRPQGKKYEIIAGERRWRAALEAGCDSVPVVSQDLDDEAAFLLMAVENSQRQGLTDYEEAEGFKAFLDRDGNAQDLAEKMGIKPGYIVRRARVMELPEYMLKDWQKGTIGYPFLEVMLRLTGFEAKQQEKIYKDCLDRIKNWGWSLKAIANAITEHGISMKDCPFAKDCESCAKNTKTQRALFDEKKTAALCLDTTCYQGKLGAVLVSEGKHFRFRSEININTDVALSVPKNKECKGCAKRGPILNPDGSVAYKDVCFDRACAAGKAKTKGKDGETTQAAPETKREKICVNHAKEARDAFYKEMIVNAVKTGTYQDANQKVLLMAMLLNARNVYDILDLKSDTYIPQTDWWKAIEGASIEQVEAFLVKAIRSAINQSALDYDVKRAMSEFLGYNLKTDWLLNIEFLGRKTKDEIITIGNEFTPKLWEIPSIHKYILLHFKETRLENLKKKDLLAAIFESDTDLTGLVPAEILEPQK